LQGYGPGPQSCRPPNQLPVTARRSPGGIINEQIAHLVDLIRSYHDTGATTQILEPETVAVAMQLMTTARAASPNLPMEVILTLAELHWIRYLAGNETVDLDHAKDLYGPVYLTDPRKVPAGLASILAAEIDSTLAMDGWTETADTLLRSVDDAYVAEQVDWAVYLYRRVLAERHAKHPDQARMMSDLGYALLLRYDHTGVFDDLSDSVDLGRKAISGTPKSHPNLGMRLYKFGCSLGRMHEVTRVPAQLDEAIKLTRKAANATRMNGGDSSDMRNVLAQLLLTKFKIVRRSSDLNQATKEIESAIS
jgi:hypothetical protein